MSILNSPSALTKAFADILEERDRQIREEGWTAGHDDQHDAGQLATAAACYALSYFDGVLNITAKRYWPWDMKWWKPKDYRRNLVIAAALIHAEIERFDRQVAGTRVWNKAKSEPKPKSAGIAKASYDMREHVWGKDVANYCRELETVNDKLCRIKLAAYGLISRGDFWSQAKNSGIALPGEYDDLLDVFKTKAEQAS